MGEKASGKLDPRIMKKTQDTLGKIIKKPPLTEKLLSKPPFRFLHDIITTTIRQTSFMKGLFTESEMVSDNVKDRDSKIAFLQKAIDFVGFVNDTPVAVKPTKIVAGHDADRTNEFLQYLATAINKKVNNEEYVKKFLKGDDSRVPSGSKKESDHSMDRKKRGKDGEERKSSEKDIRHNKGERSREERSADKGREHSRDRGRTQNGERENEKEERRSSTRDRKEHKKDRRDSERHHREEDKDKDRDERKKRRQRGDEKEKDSRSSKDGGGEEPATMMSQETEESAEEMPAQAARIPRPSSAKGSRRRHGHGTPPSLSPPAH